MVYFGLAIASTELPVESPRKRVLACWKGLRLVKSRGLLGLSHSGSALTANDCAIRSGCGQKDNEDI